MPQLSLVPKDQEDNGQNAQFEALKQNLEQADYDTGATSIFILFYVFNDPRVLICPDYLCAMPFLMQPSPFFLAWSA